MYAGFIVFNLYSIVSLPYVCALRIYAFLLLLLSVLLFPCEPPRSSPSIRTNNPSLIGLTYAGCMRADERIYRLYMREMKYTKRAYSRARFCDPPSSMDETIGVTARKHFFIPYGVGSFLYLPYIYI